MYLRRRLFSITNNRLRSLLHPLHLLSCGAGLEAVVFGKPTWWRSLTGGFCATKS